MVSLNLTLLIELGLFLLFLWGTARFILRPVIQNLDAREQQIEVEGAEAEQNTEKAGALDAQYSEALSEARRSADDTFQKARRDTLMGHTDAVGNARTWADDAVAEAHQDAAHAMEQERADLKQSVNEIAELIAQRLRPEGSSR